MFVVYLLIGKKQVVREQRRKNHEFEITLTVITLENLRNDGSHENALVRLMASKICSTSIIIINSLQGILLQEYDKMLCFLISSMSSLLLQCYLALYIPHF